MPFDAYIKFSGLDGSYGELAPPSNGGAPGHVSSFNNWSQITDFKYSLGSDKPEFEIAKFSDATTTTLYKTLCWNLEKSKGSNSTQNKQYNFEKIFLKICRNISLQDQSSFTRFQFLSYEFEHCKINNMSLSVDDNGAQHDDVTISFRVMRLKYDICKITELGGKQSMNFTTKGDFAWDFRKNTTPDK
jgi:type VI protein secretion system component Hcp